ncbi:hypothetical protein BJX99DRAFT_262127 [Aspergillus californicus]
MPATNFIFFDNNAKRRLEVLRRLAHDRDNPLLAHFMRRTALLLREEVSRHPPHIQDQIPPFANIIELIERSHGQDFAVIDYALLCMYQIGSLLVNTLAISTPETTHVLGFDTGLIAATVLAVCADAGELAEIGPWAVVLALRLAIHIARIASFHRPRSLDGIDSITSPGSFSNERHVYGTEEVDEILRGWYGEQHFRRTRQQRTISSPNHTTTANEDGYELLQGHLREVLQGKVLLTALCTTVAATGATGERKLFAVGHGSGLDELLVALDVQHYSNILLPEREFTDVTPEKNQAIAIIGYSGRFPGAEDADRLWELLRDGQDVHQEVPKERFDINTHYDASGARKNTTQTRFGGFIENPGLFDPRFFNVSPREALQMDPVQRLTLLTAYEALEMAGLVAGRTPASQSNRIGTFYGQASDDWREVNSAQDIDTYFIPGGIRAFTPGRINYHFKFSGPSYSVDTACSSSFAAIQLACTSLARGECDAAIAGGGNVLTNPDIFAGLSRGYFLSPTGQCKTFDDKADGYCRADGVASIVLKRLADAEADNDNVFAVILGSKTNHSAEAVSITRPDHGAQAFLCRSVMEEAGVDPHGVEYVEMHGTGTQAGDYNEMLSVSEVFACQETDPRTLPLYVGAIKANIGHGEAASGVMSLIKVLKMMEHNAIPPNIGITSGVVNHKFPRNLTERNLHIATELTSWAPRIDASPRLVFLNNFSAAGGNTAILLQEGPRRSSPSNMDPRSCLVVSVSARSPSALKNNMKNLATYLARNPSTSIADLSYTTTARRLIYNHRFACASSDITAVQKALTTASEHDVHPVPPQKVAFVFTGQGAMYPSIARVLFETSSQFRITIQSCESLAKIHGFPSFVPVIDGSVSSLDAVRPVLVQLATVCVQIALVELWTSWGIKPAAVIGHSIGEYAALYTAGALSASEVIRIVGTRAELMEMLCTAGSHGMLAVQGCRESWAQYLTGSDVDIACESSPDETVAAGPQKSIDRLAAILAAQGVGSKKLGVPYAFHSSQMDPILDGLKRLASESTFSPPTTPIISSLLGRRLEPTDLNARYLVRHSREPVRFSTAVTNAREEGIIDSRTIWIEVGSHPICTGMLKSLLGSETVSLASLRRSEDPWTTLSSSIAKLFNRGLSINWSEYHRDFEHLHRLLTLPPYAFDLKNYWIDYKNDWCLAKGDAEGLSYRSAPKTYLSLTVQEILEETIQDGTRTLLAQSDISHPKLRALILGHRVNGVGLCPSTVYADMALTIGNYLYKKASDGTAPAGMNICSMEVGKPLVLNTDEAKPQLVRITATHDGGTVGLKFFGVDSKGHTLGDFATCRVKYGDPTKWLRKWDKNAYLVQGQIERLEAAVGNANTHRLGRGMVYKLFSVLVDYAETYQGIDEVVLDAAAFEAAATVTFKSGDVGDGEYYMDPRWIDSLCHISGFIVNASEATASDRHVYISHGWESLCFASTVSREKRYQCYARMVPVGNSTVRQGDVYILDGNRVIGLAGGVKFQSVPRELLDHLLPPGNTLAKVAPPKTTPRTGEKSVMQARSTSETPAPTTVPLVKARAAKVLDVIAEECNLELHDLDDSAAFEDLGLDSLLSLTILARLREDAAVDLPSSVFVDNATIGQLKKMLALLFTEEDLESPPDLTPSRNSSASRDSTQDGEAAMNPDDVVLLEQALRRAELPSAAKGPPRGLTHEPQFKALSFLITGNPRTARETVFFFPDGSGSATSYAPIPTIGANVCAYALNCPFLKAPEKFTCGIPGVTALYLDEIKRRQPNGPYTLGGWSTGGVMAYEAALQLHARGEIVSQLILIDSPCPVKLEPMPSKLFHFFDSIHVLGDRRTGEPPSYLIPHFEATIRNVDTYVARPFQHELGGGPRVLAIWAREGVCKEPGDPRPLQEPGDPNVMHWLLDNRTDFGPNGWDQLLGSERFTCVATEGNHFSMMLDPLVEEVGRLIRENLSHGS